ncbi:MAG: hypothetical protein AAGJ35_11640 [Myxococcota bacterium]
MLQTLAYLFRPKRLLEQVRAHKLKMTGFLGFLFALLLTLLTALPVFGILLGKLMVEGGPPVENLSRAVWMSFVLLLGVPLLKWFGFGVLLRLSLGRGERETQPLSLSAVLLARSLGLVPMVLFLPLKVILMPPTEILSHIFFPPISALALSGLDVLLTFADGPLRFFSLFSPSPYTRPSFVLSLLFWGITLLMTWRKMTQLSDLSPGFLFWRTFMASLVWDALCCVCVLWAFHPSVL